MSAYLRTEEVAARWFRTAKNPTAAARQWCQRRGIPSERLGPRLLLWREDAIRKLLRRS